MSTSSSTGPGRVLTSVVRATCGRGCARTSARAAAAGGGGGARRARPRRAGACRAGSSRRGSRSCASCASCGRPRTHARPGRPPRHLRARGEEVVVTGTPGPAGRSRADPRVARRRSHGRRAVDPGSVLPCLRAAAAHADALRYEDVARLRDRIDALEDTVARLRRLDRLRTAELCCSSPQWSPARRAVFVAGGRVAAVRRLPPGGGAAVEPRRGSPRAGASSRPTRRRTPTEPPLSPRSSAARRPSSRC